VVEMKKLIVFLIVAVLFVAGCANKSQIDGNVIADSELPINIEKLEIYHFHGTHQCYSCKTVGAYAEETVNTYFADELKSGKLVFDHVNRDFPENVELTKKYGVAGSSLMIGIYDKEGNFHSEENTNVWYKISDKADYMNYLKVIIEQKLTGN
jgi:uncharacterized lipoprotein NlpE involved in copper resistance